jgi:tetratricopeptide (TPR) repeat protein
MSTKTNPGRPSNKRKPQLDAVLIQLSSQRPSDVWRGMEQIRQWLKENAEDRDVYGLLLDAVQKNRDLREQIRSTLVEMMQNGSKLAEQAILSLPSSVQDFLADANDAYYAAEYDRAIQLYRQVLRLDSENIQAKDHIAKAEIKRITGESPSGLPRVAEQYYRRARSYIAARDVVTAMNLLNAAIEAAQAKNIKYSEAEEALSNMNNLLLADDFRQKAKTALGEKQWQESLEFYNKALTLDPTNELTKKEFECLQDLLRAEAALKKRGMTKAFMSIGQLQNTVDAARIVMNSGNPLLSYVERQLSQIRSVRATGVILLLIIIIFPLYRNGNFSGLFTSVSTDTPVIITIATDTPEMLPTSTAQATEEVIVTNTQVLDTKMPEPTPTETLTPPPTEVILGNGYVNKGIASTWVEPNGVLIERLSLNHLLIILEKKDVAESTWYRCRWDSNGVIQEGWILAEYVTFGNPP